MLPPACAGITPPPGLFPQALPGGNDFDDLFGVWPGTPLDQPITFSRGAYVALPFIASASGTGPWQLLSTMGFPAPDSLLASIASCPGDFSGSEDPQCVISLASGDGAIRAQLGSGPFCELNPDQLYFINLAFVTPVFFEDSCSSGSCSVLMRPEPGGLSSTGSALDGVCVPPTFAVRGSVAGLSGTGLRLQLNDGLPLEIAANGPFVFPTRLDDEASYLISIDAQPDGPSQTCSVFNGDGVVMGADASDVLVTCLTNQFSIGGIVTGLVGDGLQLQLNGTELLPVVMDGAFSFTTRLTDLAPYTVTVEAQPTAPTQNCEIDRGIGTLAGDDALDIVVRCSNEVLDSVPPPSPPVPGDRLGAAVQITDDALAIGIPGADSVAFYDTSARQLDLVTTLSPPAGALPGFGSQLVLNDRFLIVGTGGVLAGRGVPDPDALSVLIMERLGLGFAGFAEIKAGEAKGGGELAFDRDVLFVGNPVDASVSSFEFSATGVSTGPLVFPFPSGRGELPTIFGLSVGTLDRKLAVGATGTIGEALFGAVSLYALVAGNFGLELEPAPSPVLIGDPGDRFGTSVALSGEVLVVGAPGRDGGDGGVDLFSLPLLFDPDVRGPVPRVTIEPPFEDGPGGFGASVAIEGELLAVGGPAVQPPGFGTGVVYFYELDALRAELRARLTSPPPSVGTGTDVDIAPNGDLAVGAPATAEESGDAQVRFSVLFSGGFEGE